MAPIFFDSIQSPVGEVLLTSNGRALTRVYFTTQRGALTPSHEWRRDPQLLAVAKEQLEGYFAGEIEQFELELEPTGTAFQRRVWQELARIPFGETRTYRRVAELVGRPSAARAVGAANGQNPISIVVPCHRVIGADGSLTGYAGGEARKSWLLTLEGASFGRVVAAQLSLENTRRNSARSSGSELARN